MLPPAESIQIVLPVVSVVFLLLTFKRSVYGTISYFIILNAKLGDMYPALGAIRFELVAAIIVLLSIVAQGKGLQNISSAKNTLNKPLWILFAIGMLSVIQSVDVSVSWDSGGYNLLKLVLFYVMMVASINDRDDLSKMVWAFVLMTAWTAYEPVVNYLSGVSRTQGYGQVAIGRFGAATGHVALANTLNQGIPLIFFWALTRKKTKPIVWSLLVLVILGVIFSKSRGGFVGLVAVGAGLAFFSKSKVKSLLLVSSLFVLLLPFAGEDYVSHVGSIQQGHSASRSTNDRYLGLVNGISMMIKRPLLGVGIGCYARARQIYFNYYFFAHNLYGELFGELGLASFFWFYWIYNIVKRASQLKKRLVEENEKVFVYALNGVQIGLFVRLVVGNFSHCAFIWFWFFMAAVVVAVENIYADELAKSRHSRESGDPVFG